MPASDGSRGGPRAHPLAGRLVANLVEAVEQEREALVRARGDGPAGLGIAVLGGDPRDDQWSLPDWLPETGSQVLAPSTSCTSRSFTDTTPVEDRATSKAVVPPCESRAVDALIDGRYIAGERLALGAAGSGERCAPTIAKVCDLDRRAGQHAVDDPEHTDHGAAVAMEWPQHRGTERRKPFKQSELSHDPGQQRVDDRIEILLGLREKNNFQRRARRLR